MNNSYLPKYIDKVIVPPIKCQGIKTKLLDFIASSIKWQGNGRWIEPFLGSGVVLFNINPRKALVSDTNKHIINFYKDLQKNVINEFIVKEYLEDMGSKLSKQGSDLFYNVRDEFNRSQGDSLRLLFLNRSCFNGMMRFNSQGQFNVPFGHKPERFRQAYVTKIVNQVSRIRQIIQTHDWEFRVSHWENILAKTDNDDFVYMDPPYIGRNTDYYNSWTEEDAIRLAREAAELPCGFALSMWKENKYRKNTHLDQHWNEFEIKTFSHFYHVGSKEQFRNEMLEALVIKTDFLADSLDETKYNLDLIENEQLRLVSPKPKYT